MMDSDQSADKAAHGLPIRMEATCSNCGYTYRGGTVSVWLEKGECGYVDQPRRNVSFKCTKGCEEVHQMEVQVVERR